MNVSRSGYYDWWIRPTSEHDISDNALKVKIKKIHKKNKRRYGSRRIKDDLADEELMVSRRRILRLMSEEGLRCKVKRKFRVTTDSNHGKAVAENLSVIKLMTLMLEISLISPHVRAGCIYPSL